jgi:prepilin-type N-terminal cleavage/methylation domain-containing protein
MKRRLAGFTLLEVTLCLIIVAVLAVAAQPYYVSFISHDRVRRAADRLAADIYLAQSEAIKQQANVTITFDADNEKYTLSNLSPDSKGATTREVSLGSSEAGACLVIGVDFGGGKALVFNAYGIPASAGSVTLGTAYVTCAVSVDAVLGKVTIGPLVGTTTTTDAILP